MSRPPHVEKSDMRDVREFIRALERVMNWLISAYRSATFRREFIWRSERMRRRKRRRRVICRVQRQQILHVTSTLRELSQTDESQQSFFPATAIARQRRTGSDCNNSAS